MISKQRTLNEIIPMWISITYDAEDYTFTFCAVKDNQQDAIDQAARERPNQPVLCVNLGKGSNAAAIRNQISCFIADQGIVGSELIETYRFLVNELGQFFDDCWHKKQNEEQTAISGTSATVTPETAPEEENKHVQRHHEAPISPDEQRGTTGPQENGR